MRYDEYDEYDDWKKSVDQANEEHLLDVDSWYRRAKSFLGEMTPQRGAWLQQLAVAVENRCIALFEAAWSETEDAMADAAAYAKDPYAYYGVSRKDFM